MRQWLDPTDGLLDVRRKGLNAQADPRHICRCKDERPFGRKASGVEFDRNFRPMRVEHRQGTIEQTDEFDRRERVGAAAAKSDAPDPAPPAQTFRDHGDFRA